MRLKAAAQWAAAVAVRLLLAALGAGEALLWQPEVSTPANTLLKTREGLRLLQLGVSPYRGASCHVPPLWLAVAAPCAHHPLLYVLPGIVSDLAAAAALYVGASALYGASSSSSSNGRKAAQLPYERDAPWLSPGQLALLYLYNPFAVMSCVAGTMSSAENAAVMLAVAGGCAGNAPLAGFGLALGGYLGLHPLLLLVPVLLLMWRGPEDVLQHVAPPRTAQQLPPGDANCCSEDSSMQERGGYASAQAVRCGGRDEGSPGGDGAAAAVGSSYGAAGSTRQLRQRQHQQPRSGGSGSGSGHGQGGQQQAGAAAAPAEALAGGGQQQARARLCVAFLACFACCSAALLLLSDRVLLRHPDSQCLPQLRQWLRQAAAGGASARRPLQQLGGCWAGRVYGLGLLLQDLTPTIGLWWYFFTEVFTEFRSFFLFVFHSFAPALALPLALRFGRRPVFVAWALLLVGAMFRPYACVGDAVPWLALLPLLQQQLQSMRLRMFLVNSGVLLLVLGPAMWHQWIVADSANANFFYSITLLLGVWYTVVLMQLLRLTCLLDRCLAGKGPAPRLVALGLPAGAAQPPQAGGAALGPDGGRDARQQARKKAV